jgi:hypothetical protein
MPAMAASIYRLWWSEGLPGSEVVVTTGAPILDRIATPIPALLAIPDGVIASLLDCFDRKICVRCL